MREIKFRGKDKFDQWIYGYLCEQFISQDGRQVRGKTIQYLNGLSFSYRWIPNESTIGQYTGLKDKNGKDIYEGDILCQTDTIQNYDDDDIVNPRNYNNPQYSERQTKSKVYFHNACFIANIFNRLDWNTIEVIGNIHDNPELLTE